MAQESTPIEFELQEAIREADRLTTDLRAIDLRTTLALFASSFLLVFWFFSILNFPVVSQLSPTTHIIFDCPVVLNIVAWSLFTLDAYRRILAFARTDPYSRGDRLKVEDVVYRYRSLQVTVARRSRLAVFISATVAFQVVTMGICLVLLSTIRSGI